MNVHLSTDEPDNSNTELMCNENGEMYDVPDNDHGK
jgi:hypothetical protein